VTTLPAPVGASPGPPGVAEALAAASSKFVVSMFWGDVYICHAAMAAASSKGVTHDDPHDEEDVAEQYAMQVWRVTAHAKYTKYLQSLDHPVPAESSHTPYLRLPPIAEWFPVGADEDEDIPSNPPPAMSTALMSQWLGQATTHGVDGDLTMDISRSDSSHTINHGGSHGDISIGLRDDKDTPYSHPHLWLGADPFRFQ
jgi:hypothetical protein